MRVVPIRYTSDVAASRRFYLALGLSPGTSSRPGSWVELPATSGMLALHSATDMPPGACELAFETSEPLAAVAARPGPSSGRPSWRLR